MKTYNISLEITLNATTPIEAAKQLQNWIKENETNWQFYVQEDGSKEIYSVDLEEPDEDSVLIANGYTPIIN